MVRWWFAIPLWGRVFMALVAGIVLGLGLQAGLKAWGVHIGIAPDQAQSVAAGWIKTWLGPFGDLFIRLLRMIIVPLIMTTLVAGIVQLGDPKRLGTVGIKTLLLYVVMTLIAVSIGLTFGTVLQPGSGLVLTDVGAGAVAFEPMTISERLLAIVPQNPVEAMVRGDVLSLIFFSILFGIGIILCGPSAKPVADVFTAASEAILKVTQIVMEFAPLGVFALMAYTVASQGIEIFASVFKLIACVYLALITYMLLVYGGIIKLWLKLPLWRFFFGMADAQAVAYSTASSSAALPVTMNCTTQKLGVPQSIAGSTLPLGAVINMDGTALYQGILACFAAQAFGYHLGPAEYAIILVTASLVSIGTASIPSASLFLMAIVMSTFGVTPEQVAMILAFVLPVDRIMDMARTTVNVASDAVVALAVAKTEGEFDSEIYMGKKVYEPTARERDDLV